jgi:hypothetical protein
MNEISLDQFLENESIFTRVQTLSPYPFFDTMQALDMDKHLSIKYGERIVYSKIINLDLDTIARLIIGVNGDKWENLILANNLDILNGSERTVNESNSSNVINTGANTRTHKVSGFNDPVLIEDSADVDSSTGTVDNTGNKLLTEKTRSLMTAYNNLQLQTKLNIIETVVKDVSNYLTLDIY